MAKKQRNYTVKGSCTIYFRDQFVKSFSYRDYDQRKRHLDEILKNVAHLSGTLEIIIAPETKQ